MYCIGFCIKIRSTVPVTVQYCTVHTKMCTASTTMQRVLRFFCLSWKTADRYRMPTSTVPQQKQKQKQKQNPPQQQKSSLFIAD